MDYNIEDRTKVVTLYSGAPLSMREISRRTKIPLTNVHRIIHHFKSTGRLTTLRKGRCGRKKKSWIQFDRMLLRRSQRNPRLTAVDRKRDTNTGLSVHTIRRRLLEGGRKAVKPVKKPLLTKKMKEKRYKWAKERESWTSEDWSKVGW